MLGEARSRASPTKEARVVEVQAFQVAVEVVKAFKIGGEYHHMVLDSYKDAFWHNFEL